MTMDREFAEVMKRHVDAVDLLLGAMTEIIEKQGPEEQKAEMTRGVFQCVNELYMAVSKPIADVFPDLHPDKDKM